MDLQERLAQQKVKGLYRSLKLNDGSLIDFQSNDYLGYARLLAKGDIVSNHLIQGATGSRLISGNHTYHEETESMLSAYFGSEEALLFSSGYQANIGVLSCMAGREDIILYDEHVHASMHDGMRLNLAKRYSFHHNNLNDLEEKIIKYKDEGRILVAIESLYSMTGDTADLEGLVVLNNKHDFVLVVDEAHAAGVLGMERKGIAMQWLGQFKEMVRILTFSKAFGYAGAVVLGSKQIKEYLINFSRPFIYTTAMPLNDVLTIQQIIKYHHNNSSSINNLNKVIEYYLDKVQQIDFPYSITKNKTPIQYITLIDNEKTLDYEQKLKDAGLLVKAIRPPTVPEGNSGLRFSLHAFNTPQQIDLLIDQEFWKS